MVKIELKCSKVGWTPPIASISASLNKK